MKHIITSIARTFASRKNFNATMIIAGQTINRIISARDLTEATRIAEIIIDDFGFLIDIR